MALLKQRWPYENTPFRVTNNKRILVASINIPYEEFEDIDKLIHKWSKTDLGKFVIENGNPAITIHTIDRVERMELMVNIVAYFDEKTEVFYKLKYK